MIMGLPVVGLATTELSTLITNGKSGYIHTDVSYLIDKMKLLLDQRDVAKTNGDGGREVALSRFNIQRFTYDWENLFKAAYKRTLQYITNNNLQNE